MPQWNRNFTYVNHETGEESGRYIAHTPKQAGRKCASAIYKIKEQMGQSIPNEIIFCMREYTRGSQKKIYSYKASRISLNNPIQINYHGHPVIYKHKIVIHKTVLPQVDINQLTCYNKFFIAYHNKKFKQPNIQKENNADENLPNISIPILIPNISIMSLVIEV